MQGKEASFRKHKIEQRSIRMALAPVWGHLYASAAFWKGLGKKQTSSRKALGFPTPLNAGVLCSVPAQSIADSQGHVKVVLGEEKNNTCGHGSIWISRQCREPSSAAPQEQSPLLLPSPRRGVKATAPRVENPTPPPQTKLHAGLRAPQPAVFRGCRLPEVSVRKAKPKGRFEDVSWKRA